MPPGSAGGKQVKEKVSSSCVFFQNSLQTCKFEGINGIILISYYEYILRARHKKNATIYFLLFSSQQLGTSFPQLQKGIFPKNPVSRSKVPVATIQGQGLSQILQALRSRPSNRPEIHILKLKKTGALDSMFLLGFLERGDDFLRWPNVSFQGSTSLNTNKKSQQKKSTIPQALATTMKLISACQMVFKMGTNKFNHIVLSL